MPTRAASPPPPLEVRAAVRGAGSAFVRAVQLAPQVEQHRRHRTEQRAWRRSRAVSYKLDLEDGMQASESPVQGQSRMRARNGSGVWVAREVARQQCGSQPAGGVPCVIVYSERMSWDFHRSDAPDIAAPASRCICIQTTRLELDASTDDLPLCPAGRQLQVADEPQFVQVLCCMVAACTPALRSWHWAPAPTDCR